MASSLSPGLLKSPIGEGSLKVDTIGKADGDEKRKIVKSCYLGCYSCSHKGKKNVLCGKCGKAACQLHSGVTKMGSKERSCDECVREMVRGEMDCAGEFKKRVREEIQVVLDEREEKVRSLNKESTKGKNLQIEFKERSDLNDKNKQELSARLSALQDNNKKMEKEIEDWTNEIEKYTKNNENLKLTTKDLTHESSALEVKLEEMIKERTGLLNTLNELRDFIRTQVPVKLIKKLICSKCYFKVQNTFASMFNHVVPVKQEHIKQDPPAKKGACTSCTVY